MSDEFISAMRQVTDDLLFKKIDLKILNPIGKGGQKQVFLAEYNNSKVVFKLVTPTKNTAERVRREIRAVNLINHSNVPRIIKSNIDSEKSEDFPVWIIEEYVNGETLREVINKKKLFSIFEVIGFFETMLSILTRSEKLLIVHRDIKPENIMVDLDNNFWLIDFGISRHLDLESITSSAALTGPHTLGYSAAEQLRNRKKDIDIRADLFSLGVVAAEMIIGENPYLDGTEDVLQLIKKIESQPLPILRIDGDSQYLLAQFIKTLGDNRSSRRPRDIDTVLRMFKLVKESII